MLNKLNSLILCILLFTLIEHNDAIDEKYEVCEDGELHDLNIGKNPYVYLFSLPHCHLPLKGITICRNGSPCTKLDTIPIKDDGRTFGCDCSKTDGVVSYAGYECEYKASHYCLYGTNSDVSFCTNGKCKEVWSPKEDESPRYVIFNYMRFNLYAN